MHTDIITFCAVNLNDGKLTIPDRSLEWMTVSEFLFVHPLRSPMGLKSGEFLSNWQNISVVCSLSHCDMVLHHSRNMEEALIPFFTHYSNLRHIFIPFLWMRSNPTTRFKMGIKVALNRFYCGQLFFQMFQTIWRGLHQ